VRRRFNLDRLSPVAVGALAATHGLIGSSIHEITGGNPLLVTEILAAGGKRSASIDDLVLGRADRLDAEARDFLNYCSIIPRRVSFEQILAANPSDAAIEACINSTLLQSDADGLAFRHEINRHAVEAALSPVRRVTLHSRELERLEQAGATPARRLHHAIGANDARRIVELAPLAARQASALGGHRDAASAWASFFDKADPPFDPEQCAQYAFELHVTGEVGRAIEWQKRALDEYEVRGDRLRQGDTLRFLSRIHYLNGQRALAEEAGAKAVSILAEFPDTPELALAYANLAHLAMLADDRSQTVRWSELAISIAERLGRDDILSTVLNNYGTALQYIDRDRCHALLDRSIDLGKKSGTEEHVARAYTNKSWAFMQARQLTEALAVQEAGIDYCRERDLETWADYMTGGRALALLDLGRWDEAEEAAVSVVSRRMNTPLMRNPAVRALALLRTRQGGEQAGDLIAELGDHMASGREAPRFTSLALIVAEHTWTRGAPVQAAVDLLEEAAALAGEEGSPWDRGALWAWRQRLGAASSPPAGMAAPFEALATDSIERAASIYREQRMPFEEAMALAFGTHEQRARAAGLLDRLGSSATAERVRANLENDGFKAARGPRASTRANPFGLTRREVDVLAAIDKGWTNKEIGERLFVSAKTVDHHVSSILSKVNARTRGEASSIARAHGLID
jgi:DNA-binding CsgD family transcriptional regulator/tetratricopeptide (TPR) repeat protein